MGLKLATKLVLAMLRCSRQFELVVSAGHTQERLRQARLASLCVTLAAELEEMIIITIEHEQNCLRQIVMSSSWMGPQRSGGRMRWLHEFVIILC